MKISDFFRRVKEDKDFRYDFIIGVWSAIIIIVIIVAVIAVSMFLLRGNKKDDDLSKPSPSPEISEEMEDMEGTDEEEATATPEAADEEKDEEEDDERRFSENIDGDIEFEENENTPKLMYATTTVNVRSNPDTRSNTLGRLAKGDSVELVEKMNNGWTKVKYNNTEAYVKSEFLTDGSSTYTVPDGTNPANSDSSAITTKAPSTTAKPAASSKPAATAKPKATKKPKATAAPKDDSDSDDSSSSDSKNDTSDSSEVKQNTDSEVKESSPTAAPANQTTENSTPVPDATAPPASQDQQEENVNE